MADERGRPFVAQWREAVRESDADSTAKTVAWALSTWMNSSGSAFPSKQTIARGASLSVRAVDAAIDRLDVENGGELLIVSRRRGSRGWRYQAVIRNEMPDTNRHVVPDSSGSSQQPIRHLTTVHPAPAAGELERSGLNGSRAAASSPTELASRILNAHPNMLDRIKHSSAGRTADDDDISDAIINACFEADEFDRDALTDDRADELYDELTRRYHEVEA